VNAVPGNAAEVPGCDHETGCITCGDRAEEARVLRIDDARGLALCRNAGGASETVEIALVGPVSPGDVLLVHAGTAIARVEGAPA
jgi:hydrogenase maturation factor